MGAAGHGDAATGPRRGTRPGEQGEARRLRSLQNKAAGLFFSLGVTLFTLFFNPLFVFEAEAAVSQGADSLAPLLLFTALAAGISLAGHLYYGSTSVLVTERHVVLVNPFRRVQLPRTGTDVLTTGRGHPRLRYDGLVYTAWGAEGRSAELSTIVAGGDRDGARVETAWRRPSGATITLGIVWSAYVIAGAVLW